MAYSATLSDSWSTYFEDKVTANQPNIFLENNACRCLQNFIDFAKSYSDKVKEVAKLQQVDPSSLWLTEQIGNALDIYWGPLSQALTQYASPPYKDYLKNIKKTDQGLYTKIDSYLRSVNSLFGLTSKDSISVNDIVLFFDEQTVIRRPPYTKMALISTPFRVFDSKPSTDEKLTGIAHELGHYLYWHLGNFSDTGGAQSQAVEAIVMSLIKDYKHTEEQVRFVKAWIEEMFADYIGAKIAGGTFANTGKDLIIRRNKSSASLGENDGTHPPDILRPLIGMYVSSIEQNKNTKTRAQKDTLQAWKDFFLNSFSFTNTDMSKTEIVSYAEHEGEEDLKRSPEELSQIILDTVDIFFEKQSLFKPNLTAPTTAGGNWLNDVLGQMETRAQAVDKDKVLELLLDPIGLEAGTMSHTHKVRVVGASSHGNAILQLQYPH